MQQQINAFKRGTKREVAVYHQLKDDKLWDSWNRMVLTLARTHDVSEVFDPEYQPKDTLESELFEQKQSFVYSVFNKCILTDIGKTLVRLHEKTFDAQAVYKGLFENAKNSTAASLSISKLIEYLTTAKLDSRWNGSSTSFILNWRDRMRIYEELTPLDEHHNDGLKKRMLEVAVHPVP
jgi:hypothetical protein